MVFWAEAGGLYSFKDVPRLADSDIPANGKMRHEMWKVVAAAAAGEAGRPGKNALTSQA
jgi:hypothetical protein